MHLPHVSIVIVAYNEERNIADCLNSLQRLEYPPDRHEIIVVDSSSDKTPDIVRSYPNVSLVLSDRRDFSIVRNRGLREARHDLIAYIDADCIAPADWLLRLVPKIDLPDVAAVAGTQFLYATRDRRDRLLSDGDQSGATAFNLWSPKAGLLWQIDPTWQAFANVSRSAEVPSFGESANGRGIPTIPFTSIRPQRATTYEIGTRGKRPDLTWT